MKASRPVALLLAAALLVALSGCAPILSRTYSAETAHVSTGSGADDALSADSYNALIEVLLSRIALHESTCSVQLPWPDEDPTERIQAACQEILQGAPLGVYAVEDITFDVVRIVSYYEANFSIDYLRSAAEVNAIRDVVGTYGVRLALADTLAAFRPTLTLHTAYYSGDTAAIEALVRKVYEEQPLSALGLQSVTVALYPEEGPDRILELAFDYGQDPETLAERQAQLQERLEEITITGDEAEQALSLCRFLSANARLLTPEDPASLPFCASAWDTLCNGAGTEESFALAYACLCQSRGINCSVLHGTRTGVPCVWDLVTLSDGTQFHVNAARSVGLYSDEEVQNAGYVWE